MDNKLQLRVKSTYGRDLFYPINETALQFCKLLGRKTLVTNDLSPIKALGYEIELLAPSLEATLEATLEVIVEDEDIFS